jgi:hypothetical protein
MAESYPKARTDPVIFDPSEKGITTPLALRQEIVYSLLLEVKGEA